LVIAALQGDDLILCQITSQARADGYSIRLDDADFAAGGLPLSSRTRPNRLFTADTGIIVYRAGHVSEAKLGETVDRLIGILLQGRPHPRA
jgi:mRNA interferase MazF